MLVDGTPLRALRLAATPAPMGLIDTLNPETGMLKLGLILAALAIPLTGWGVQTWRLHSAHTLIAETARSLDAALHARDEAVAANASLSHALATQNAAVASLATQGAAREKVALKAATSVLAKPMPVIAGHGPMAMNAFMREVFSAP